MIWRSLFAAYRGESQRLLMQSVVLLQGDSRVAQSLSASMSKSFHSVHAVQSLEELRSRMIRHRAEVLVVDLEVISVSDLQALSKEFPGITIVCTHRLADEEMWAPTLNAGAADICPASDTRAITTAALRNAAIRRSAAA
jgi:DNA-binding NtrC family response regulator